MIMLDRLKVFTSSLLNKGLHNLLNETLQLEIKNKIWKLEVKALKVEKENNDEGKGKVRKQL